MAEDWLSSHKCTEGKVVQWLNAGPRPRIWQAVSEPGLYGASWLLLKEFDAAFAHYGIDTHVLPVEFAILRESMRRLCDAHQADRVRLVFWFH